MMFDLRFSLNHKSQITNHKSQITNHKSQITNHKSQITYRPSPNPQVLIYDPRSHRKGYSLHH
jgi:hypothetical protein